MIYRNLNAHIGISINVGKSRISTCTTLLDKVFGTFLAKFVEYFGSFQKSNLITDSQQKQLQEIFLVKISDFKFQDSGKDLIEKYIPIQNVRFR